MAAFLRNYKRIVVKIGSSLLADNKFVIRQSWLSTLVEDLMMLCDEKIEIVLVSSGAVALGRGSFRAEVAQRKLSVAEKQAAAAIGQIKLLHTYQSEFLKYKREIAQVLLSLDDSETRQRYINAKNTLEMLLKHKLIPIVNENDTVATEEISYGDNDRLAARVAQMVDADLLILLSDIDGLYTANPNFDKNARHIPLIETIDADIKSMAGESHTKISSGGMITKILAAEIAVENGADMIICNGMQDHPISKLKKGSYSLFKGRQQRADARKRWISNHLNAKGTLVIDEGAKQALLLGKSLLAAGIVSTEGSYQATDMVNIYDSNNTLIALGMINYHSETIALVKGKNKQKMQSLLNNESVKAVVHRNDMVML
ncbi:glutamate 5-kinase [Fangia hongkongensis]|uniref:glutamate 5-kinase n=1 Tax=Fangia hongkongensis TaxID=270495 RepID=UPI00036496B1|nr:glutamate 5-kinase [Fangia hongkongensis]MBK2125165.1 glutamate 5-kinase [Fangia hongkongensis]